ncbi:MAG: 7-cyano-7-deazaguanine synthase QueC [Proteobacteria bacterium]|nr:7-cyano-7-deazaguanine synthase QueC [Pseudomonadota bacterium]
MSDPRKGVVLLSGGLDSATILAAAIDEGFDCYCLSFEYGQRHNTELAFARRLASRLGAIEHRVAQIDLKVFGGSALTDKNLQIPDFNEQSGSIPITYVPARNTVFLSFALAWAEVLGALDVFIGVNAVDYSGYPDCRPEFIQAFESMANLATRRGVEGQKLEIHAPLLQLSKGEIISKGLALGVDYAETVSCYQLDTVGAACGRCDSCGLRREGFAAAGVNDPTLYQAADRD